MPEVCFSPGGTKSSGSGNLDLRERLSRLLLPVVERSGATLVDLELSGSAGNLTIRLFVHKDPATSLRLCQAISLGAGEILDAEDPIPGRYRLEVTSPGLSRSLRTDQDYDRAASRQLKVVMSSGKTFHGRLLDYGCDYISLESKAGTRKLTRGEISRATIQAEL